MTALIIGATGATGKDLVKQLLQHPDYSTIIVFVRRSFGAVHPKLKEVLTDFDHLDGIAKLISGDTLFCCLGTTLKAAGSKEKQRHIDLDIPVRFAEIARANGVSNFVLVSAYGASPKSSIFYSRLKGELEQRIERLAFNSFVVFRPGMLLREDTDRPGERIISYILRTLNSLGLFRKFRPLPTRVLAEKLAKAPLVMGPGRHSLELDSIFTF